MNSLESLEERHPSHVHVRGPDPRTGCGGTYGPAAGLAREIGNRNFAQLVARMRAGEGILPGGRVDASVEAAIEAARGHGRPLDGAFSRRLGSASGESFSDVRVHTDDAAAALARAVSARAFTVGSDIFFAHGEYAPGSPGGSELIAHELAHVVQQRGASPGGPLVVSQPGDELEREAEAVSRDLVS
ncbi:MAG TPA: DUF4157 domain-containing protein [Gaiellaceae bacterium]|nr:DUF4157 domain-containing protein [Gaiellaceae bacterium]